MQVINYPGSWTASAGRLVLASRSPRRKKLLQDIGIDPVILPGAIHNEEEYFIETTHIKESVENLAKAKAQSAPGTDPQDIIIGADTVVLFEGQVLGKPVNHDEAFRTLQMLSGATHRVITGIAVLRSGIQLTSAVTTHVTFRTLSTEEINHYLSTETYGDKAGSYGIQDRGAMLVEQIRGCYYNVVGLPVAELLTLLEKTDIRAQKGRNQ
ncbi:MAG: Maf family protein [Fibrobacterota bacterium]